MKQLKIAETLSLPIDVVTQTIAVIAKRRVGKSYLMRRIVEQLFRAGQQVVLVDPKGDQWGIRSSADGKGAGLPFVILGGERGDVPLEVGAGAVVAKMLVEERVSAVLDLSLFRKREIAEFMGGPTPPRGGQEGFLEVLYRMKAQERYRTPLMLVLDEGDAIASQNPQTGEERMLGAAEDIVRRGGQRGLGCIVVTQRSAVLNKNVLTQSEILIALRTIAPQDLKAMKAWIDVHGTPEESKTLMDSLPSLPIGEAWVWSPGWPTADGIFKRIHVLPIETFDSGATPKPGEKRTEPKTVADVDLDALRLQMAETIERAKADDPKELKKKIADLERQLKAKPVAAPTPTRAPSKVDPEKERERIQKIADRAIAQAMRPVYAAVRSVESRLEALRVAHTKESDAAVAIAESLAELKTKADEIEKAGATVDVAPPRPTIAAAQPRAATPARTREIQQRLARSSDGNGRDISGPQQRILDTLALLEQLGISPSRDTLAAWYGVHPNNKGFGNNLSALRTAGMLEGASLTDVGRGLANAIAIPSEEELRDRIMDPLRGPQKTIINALLDKGRTGLTRDDLAQVLGVHPNNKGYGNNLSALRTRQLITRGSPIRPGDVFFLEGR